jgi:hypothetical protein
MLEPFLLNGEVAPLTLDEPDWMKKIIANNNK